MTQTLLIRGILFMEEENMNWRIIKKAHYFTKFQVEMIEIIGG